MKEVTVKKTIVLYDYALTLAMCSQLLRAMYIGDAKKIIKALSVQFDA